MYSEVVGIVGVASQATAHFFKRLVDAFPGEKEWDRPQVIINNDCTIPRRVRAILYGENEEQIKKKLEECVRGILCCAGEKKVHIVIDCNTAHYYIGYLKRVIPQADFINIIETCAHSLSEQGIKDAVLLATEGIFDTKIYDRYFEKYGISIESPVSEAKEIRYFKECVKQNKIKRNPLNVFHRCFVIPSGRRMSSWGALNFWYCMKNFQWDSRANYVNGYLTRFNLSLRN